MTNSIKLGRNDEQNIAHYVAQGWCIDEFCSWIILVTLNLPFIAMFW